MMPVDLHFGLFNKNFNEKTSEKIAVLWLRAMATSNLSYLHDNPEQTGPYSGKIHYILERDTQHWLPIPELHRPRLVQGPDGNPILACGGDCKDLATYAVAWYYSLGERFLKEALRRKLRGLPYDKILRHARRLQSCKVDLVPSNSGFFRYHVRNKWPYGPPQGHAAPVNSAGVEDPSDILGMGRNGLTELPTK